MHCSAREMDWKTQNPTFQVLYSVISRDDRPPPLQIRSFTSDSYEAIKERERKKSARREQNNTEQRSNAWRKKDTGASAEAAAMQEVTQIDSRPAHSGGSGTEPLVIQEDDKLQHRFSSPSVASISPLEYPPSGGIKCLPAPTSQATSPQACGSESVVCAGAEQEWEICHNGVPDPRTASPGDVHMITADGDNAATVDQQLHIRTRNDAQLAVENFPYLRPTDSSAGGRSDPCEQLMESRGTRSPSPVSLEPDSAPVVAAVAVLQCLSSTFVANGALTEAMPDGQNQPVGVARTVGSLTHRARSKRASWIDCRSTHQSAWTSGQDEQLLHLRDIAQLNWRNIVSYFPGVTLDAVKARYTYLNEFRVKSQTVDVEPKPRVQMRKRTTCLASLTPLKVVKKCPDPSWTKPRKQPISILSEHCGTPPRQRVIKQAKPTKYTASLVATTHEDVCQRNSRCGRPIRHPFRHRPNEGYV